MIWAWVVRAMVSLIGVKGRDLDFGSAAIYW